MFTKKPPTAFTINSRDPVPDPPGHEISKDLRPPPKVYYPYRDCNGISPKKIQKMIKKKKEYEEECARIQTENDIAKFEAKLKGTYVDTPETTVPSLPLPPNVDFDLLRSFEPPSATRFYDYVPPNIHQKTAKKKNMNNTISPTLTETGRTKSRTRPSTTLSRVSFKSDSFSTTKDLTETETGSFTNAGTTISTMQNVNNTRQNCRCMARGCPCCNPSHFDEIKPRTRPATRNGKPIQRPTTATPRKKANLPMQMNQAYWNVLDEPSVPARPKNVYIENPKPSQFSMLRTGPRPGGIPICVNDLVACREAGEKWFEIEMAKKKDRELFEREKLLKERSTYSRNFNLSLKEHTQEIALDSQQKWAKASSTMSLKALEASKKKQPKPPSKEEIEAMEELSKYDDKLYQEYQSKKRPTDEIELFLNQCGMREYT